MIPPCSRCPYRLGLVKTFANPCPQCKMRNFMMYKVFKRHMTKNTPSARDKAKKKV